MNIQVLKLDLHNIRVGYLIGYQDGRNILVFDKRFRQDAERPTLSINTYAELPGVQARLDLPWVKRQKLHPILSNLLPEGALRKHIAQALKVHENNEFPLFAYLGRDLPGALVASVASLDELPEDLLGINVLPQVQAIEFSSQPEKFSLAGVQMKFSMSEQEGRFNLFSEELGTWIVKTPSTIHTHVPENEYTAMRLAELAGVEIPEIRLVSLDQVEDLPDIPLPNESLAFAIKRFDRERLDGVDAQEEIKRIHTEDFAQVFMEYPDNKYSAANYEQIAKILAEYSGARIDDVLKLARRLLVNILLANGDAHLKNWSLIYSDARTPYLSPAYDILTTKVYVPNEQHYALNLGKNKSWYAVSKHHFQRWAERVGIPWRLVENELNITLEKARTLWPQALAELPMHHAHQTALRDHWKMLDDNFKLTA